jgi:lipoprotein signal peptidase
LVLFTLLLCIGADQITKEIVKSHLPKTKVLHFAGKILNFDYHLNRDAEFSFE